MTDSSRRQNKLYKDPNDKQIAGVAAGVAKYFDVDTTLVRAIWIVLAIGGVGILLYVVLWIMLEDEPADFGTHPAATEATPAPSTTVESSEPVQNGELTDTDDGVEPGPDAVTGDAG